MKGHGNQWQHGSELMQMPWQGPKWEIVAACYSLKGGRADFLMEKAAELGAYAVRPILTVRSPYLGEILFCSAPLHSPLCVVFRGSAVKPHIPCSQCAEIHAEL